MVNFSTLVVEEVTFYELKGSLFLDFLRSPFNKNMKLCTETEADVPNLETVLLNSEDIFNFPHQRPEFDLFSKNIIKKNFLGS